ncbi:MAG: response regulator [Fimbriimonadaceae bacterium]|nr:response regulator [Fimbriimonadaceae bacterium]
MVWNDALVTGVVTRIVPSGVLVRLSDGRHGRIRWRQFATRTTDLQASLGEARRYQQDATELRLAWISMARDGLELSLRQAAEPPWPGHALDQALGRPALAKVVRLVQRFAIAMLANGVEVRVEIDSLDEFLRSHRLPSAERALNLGDEVEGILQSYSNPAGYHGLPLLYLDMVEALSGTPAPGGRAPRRPRELTLEPAGPAGGGRSAQGLAVLVVEDEPEPNRALCDRLRRRGCEVASATGLDDLRRLAAAWANQGRRPQVVLLDLNIPSPADGLAAVGVINRQWPACRLVVTTAQVGSLPVAPDDGLLVSAIVMGILDDERLDRQLTTDLERHGWEHLRREILGLEEPTAFAIRHELGHGLTFTVRSSGPAESASQAEIRGLLADLTVRTGAAGAAVISMHAMRREPRIEAASGLYLGAAAITDPKNQTQVLASCISDVLLGEMAYTEAEISDRRHSRHHFHAAMLGDYRYLIALPLRSSGALRHGLFVVDPQPPEGASGSGYAAALAEVQRTAWAVEAVLNAAALSERNRVESGLLRAGLMHASIWHDLAKQLSTLLGQSERLLGLAPGDVTWPVEAGDHRELLARTCSMTSRALDLSVSHDRRAAIPLETVLDAALEAAGRWQEERPAAQAVVLRRVPTTGIAAYYLCRGNADSLERALLNLLVNAIEHLDRALHKPGEVRLGLEIGPTTAETRSELSAVRGIADEDCPEYAAVVSVVDTGPGIPAFVREDIFRPLFTTKYEVATTDKVEKEAGSGLGLAIVRALVEGEAGLGGYVYVARAPRFVGTTFRVVLPVEPQEEPS